MPITSQSLWIEGIGDDVLVALGAFFGMFVPMLVMVFHSRQFNQTIHPESAENVQTTREEINNLRADHQQADNGPDTDEQSTQTAGQQPTRENHGQHDCPICLGSAQFAVQTNCGHVYCGVCLTTYWQHGSWLGAINCPVCRQIVNIILINFTQQEHLNTSDAKRNVVDSIYQYNRRFSGEPRQWMDYIRDAPTLLRHLMRELFTVSGLVMMFQLRIVVIVIAVLLYLISPFDIIPEAVFGIFGFLDDLFIVLLLAIYVSLIYRSMIRRRAENNNH